MNLNHLVWDDLRIFLAVARLGNLSRAGRQLGIDHSTVGRRISALEYSLGTPVFERDRAGFRLNMRGRDMLTHVEAIEASVLMLDDVSKSGEHGPTGPVRIATMEGIASLYLSEQFVAFNREYPDITIELATSAHNVQVSQREADIFLGFFEPTGRDLEVRKLGQFALGLYASPDYLAAFGTPATLADLAGHRFVGYISDLIELDAVRWLEELIARPRIGFHSSSMLSQMFAASAGAGIVMLPDFARPARVGLCAVLPGQVPVRREVWLSVHRYLQRVPRIQRVVDFLVDTIKRDYGDPAHTGT
jgi:DNA-binding transcriptional LysR family regulator